MHWFSHGHRHRTTQLFTYYWHTVWHADMPTFWGVGSRVRPMRLWPPTWTRARLLYSAPSHQVSSCYV